MEFKKKIFKKLSSESGASLMVALLFFVMCATVGSIILAAATASAGRLKNLQEDTQVYYSTSSAVEAIEDLLTDTTFTIKLTPSSNFVNQSDITPSNTMVSSLLFERVSLPIQNPQFNYAGAENILFKSEYLSEQTPRTFIFEPNVDGHSTDICEPLSSKVSMFIDREMNLIVHVIPNLPTESDGTPNVRQGMSNFTVIFKPKIKIDEVIDEHDNNRTVNSDMRSTTISKIISITWMEPEVFKGIKYAY